MANRSAFFACAAAVGLSGCFPPGDGKEPELSQIYFPVGIAVSPGATRMYVANSNFDLQFNAGSLQVYDLDALRARLPVYCTSDASCGDGERCDLDPTEENSDAPSHWCVASSGPNAGRPCGVASETTPAERILAPGRCAPFDPTSGGVILEAVEIGAFATDVIYRQNPNGPGGRLYIPVRGDATLHWIDVDDDTEPSVGLELDCGQSGKNSACDDEHRRGDDPDANIRGVRMPPEPFAVAADALARSIVVTHQSDGAVSLFVDGFTGEGPRLEFVLGGLATGAVGIASIPQPKIVDLEEDFFQPGYLVTFRNSPEVRQLRVFFDDVNNSTPRPFIQNTGGAGVTANASGIDSRGIGVDPSQRQACESACADADTDCADECAGIPLDIFIANRSPATLLLGRTRPNRSASSSDDFPQFFDTLPLDFGPSRVVVGSVLGESGDPEVRVFVITFDARKIYIVDPDSRRVERVIDTGRGPHSFAVDPVNGLGFVGHFTDSYVGVIDLDKRHGRVFGTVISSMGVPTPPRAAR